MSSGLCPQSDAVLRALRAAGLPMTPRALASRVCLRESSVLGLLQKLERRGLAYQEERGWLVGRPQSERDRLRERFAGGVA